MSADLIATMTEALEAHRAWSYAETHGIGSFEQRGILCAHANSLTLRALAQAKGLPMPNYKGRRHMIVWPDVALCESEEQEARQLVALALEHEQASLQEDAA